MGYTNIEIRGYKYIYIQRWRDTSWDTQIIEMRGYKYIYIFRDGEINHGMHKYRDTGIQIYIYIQRWRDIGIGEY